MRRWEFIKVFGSAVFSWPLAARDQRTAGLPIPEQRASAPPPSRPGGRSILPKKVMDPIQLSLSLAGIAVRNQRIMIDFLTRRPDLGGLSDPAEIGQAFFDLTAKMIADPMSIAQMQLELWWEHVKLLQRTTERLAGI